LNLVYDAIDLYSHNNFIFHMFITSRYVTHMIQIKLNEVENSRFQLKPKLK